MIITISEEELDNFCNRPGHHRELDGTHFCSILAFFFEKLNKSGIKLEPEITIIDEGEFFRIEVETEAEACLRIAAAARVL